MDDMRETSAIKEASGLVDDPKGTASASGARLGGEMRRDSEAFRSDSREVAMAAADRLREVTLKAPLQALFAAFLLCVWVARRR